MKKWKWVVVLVILLQMVPVEQACSRVCEDFEWTLEPHTNGTVHVKVKVTLGSRESSFGFPSWKTTPITNMKAWEAETGNPISILEVDEGENMRHELQFEEKKGKGFQFFAEYDRLDKVEEKKSGAYYLYWGWSSNNDTTHRVTVILPKNHELLATKYINPEEVSSYGGCLHLLFSEDVSADESFQVGVTFSQKGVQLIKSAENHFRMGNYEEARKVYLEASGFYLQFPDAYGLSVGSLSLDLRHYATECEKKLAEGKFAEAVTALDAGDYERAQQLFEDAEEQYTLLGDPEKVNECRGYIDQCEQVIEKDQLKSEAESLLKQQYAEAKTKFEEALAKYTELEDEEKVEECQEWITSCEQEMPADGGGTCMGSSLVVAFVGFFLANIVKSRRK